MEGKWPSKTTSSHMWNKLRNFFAAVYELQRLGKLRSKAGKRSVEGVSTEAFSPFTTFFKLAYSRFSVWEKGA